MTRSEYQELVEFLGRRFDAIDQRFDAMDQRFDAMDQRFDAIDQRFDAIDQRFDAIETRLTRVEVMSERNLHYIQLVAEGLTAHRESTAREFAAVRREMAEGFQRQEGLLQDLTIRVERLERRSA
jgi:hypothetical protein